tara:strand:- start:236 stop:658 length:423 start_codon:yes stop_codon:yes gene_type:complete
MQKKDENLKVLVEITEEDNGGGYAEDRIDEKGRILQGAEVDSENLRMLALYHVGSSKIEKYVEEKERNEEILHTRLHAIYKAKITIVRAARYRHKLNIPAVTKQMNDGGLLDIRDRAFETIITESTPNPEPTHTYTNTRP